MHPPHPLLHLHRIPGNIDMYDAMSTLEIDAFRAGSRGDEKPGAAVPKSCDFQFAFRFRLTADDESRSLPRTTLEVICEGRHSLDRLREQDHLISACRSENVSP